MLRVIVVDDAKEDSLLTERLLQQCKILNPISLFSTGDSFLEHLEAIQPLGPDGKPENSLVLLDLVMAPTSGLEVLRFIQNSRHASNSVVVMVSGLTDVKAINEGYQLGAKTFLLKPLTAQDIVQVLNSLSKQILIGEAENGYMLYWNDHTSTEQREKLRQRPPMVALST
jgi:CheY-like chemotaxis protein